MTLARRNRKLVEQLRCALDIEATQATLDRGAITPIQARNIVKWGCPRETDTRQPDICCH